MYFIVMCGNKNNMEVCLYHKGLLPLFVLVFNFRNITCEELISQVGAPLALGKGAQTSKDTLSAKKRTSPCSPEVRLLCSRFS
jgi:hypothetical protein